MSKKRSKLSPIRTPAKAWRAWAVALPLALGLPGLPSVQAQTVDPKQKAESLWRELAINDLNALHAHLSSAHPGAVDPENPAVRAWLKNGLPSSMRLAEQAKSFAGAYFALRHFLDGFNDAHVFLNPTMTVQRVEYPGFIAATRGDRFVVVESASPLVKVGSEIISCDGVATANLYKTNVLPFHGIEGLEAQHAAFAPYLFADMGNPFVSRPRTCNFKYGNRTAAVDLAWERTDATLLREKLDSAAHGPSAEPGLEEWQPGHFWIGLPEFQFANDSRKVREENMLGLIASLKAQGDVLRRAKVIVFDVRGNQGGSSHWGDLVLQAIWGEGFTDNLLRSQWKSIEWRVSDINIAANETSLARSLKSYGPGDARTQSLQTLVSNLKDAKRRGVALMPVARNDAGQKPRTQQVAPKIILLSNGSCVSACLDFADSILSIKGAQVWGSDTEADSVYIENWNDNLPSGLFRLSWPMKVYRGRQRGNNEPYLATVRFDVPPQSKTEAKAWVERHLVGHKRAAGSQ